MAFHQNAVTYIAEMLVRLFTIIFYHSHFVKCQMRKSVIWDKDRGSFVGLFDDSRFAAFRGEASCGGLDSGTPDISGKVLKASYYEEQDIVMFYDNGTKMTGICGDIWNLLAYDLNFTSVPKKYEEPIFGEHLPNGSYSGLMGLLERNEIQVILRIGYFAFRADLFDYTTPIWTTKFRLYIRPEYGYDDKWLVTMFTRETWYIIIFLFLMLSVSGYVFQSKECDKRKRTKRKSGYFSINDHFFYTYSIMCGQGYVPDTFHSRYKILSISKRLFAWLILLAFSSNLIYRMTNRTIAPPFTSLDTLLSRTKYDLLVFKGSMIYEIMKDMQSSSTYEPYDLQDRIHFVNEPSIMYEKVCYGKKLYAVLETPEKAYSRSKNYCPLIPVGESYFQTWIGFGVPKYFPYKQAIDVSITKLHEVGLVGGLKKRWQNHPSNNNERSTFKTIDMQQVNLIFTILLIGATLSLTILFIERIVYINAKKHPMLP